MIYSNIALLKLRINVQLSYFFRPLNIPLPLPPPFLADLFDFRAFLLKLSPDFFLSLTPAYFGLKNFLLPGFLVFREFENLYIRFLDLKKGLLLVFIFGPFLDFLEKESRYLVLEALDKAKSS